MGPWLTEPLAGADLEQVRIHGSFTNPVPVPEAERPPNRRARAERQARLLL